MSRKRHSKKAPVLHAVVVPNKKEVKIMLGNKLLKRYRFKMDIPNKKVQKEVHGYDWGEWCVSDRDFTYMKEVTEWDKNVIKEIGDKTLEIYKSSTNTLTY